MFIPVCRGTAAAVEEREGGSDGAGWGGVGCFEQETILAAASVETKFGAIMNPLRNVGWLCVMQVRAPQLH